MKQKTVRILLADDDDTDRMLFRDAFSELDISTTVDTVNDGMQLMKALTKKNVLLPHLLFLDLNMPGKNGIECLKEIKTNKNMAGIFIAIYSTSAAEKDVDETFRNGANIYMNKPVSFTNLKLALEKAVTSVHSYQNLPLNRENFVLRL